MVQRSGPQSDDVEFIEIAVASKECRRPAEPNEEPRTIVDAIDLLEYELSGVILFKLCEVEWRCGDQKRNDIYVAISNLDNSLDDKVLDNSDDRVHSVV